MFSFRNDYSELCHENILKKLAENNHAQFDGYSDDVASKRVIAQLKNILDNQDVDIHFLSGGTQTNLVAISTILKPYQGVIAADTGHIATHETGAIEATGHKVITVKGENGKIKPYMIKSVIDEHYSDESREHAPQPAMVYISNPTELGTVYTKNELADLKTICKAYDIPLYMDGARLAQVLANKDTNISLKDLPNLCDLFYIGGTKNGALFGECLVISNEKYKKDFRYNLKQRGALLAKGFSISLQYEALFEDDLYIKLGAKSNENAKYIADELKKLNIKFLVPVESNQLFPILDNQLIEKLRKDYLFYTWQVIDENNSAVRLCISWDTPNEIVKKFIEDVKKYI
ncbi:MAG: threonine aldolase family protein [Pleomorphochaeta sp.]